MMSSWIFKEGFEQWVTFCFPSLKLARRTPPSSGQKEAAQSGLSFLCDNCELALLESPRVPGAGRERACD